MKKIVKMLVAVLVAAAMAGSLAVNFSAVDAEKLVFFVSNDPIAEFAESDPAVLALYEAGIISGGELGAFNPAASLTRAEMSKIVFLLSGR
jgi:hypothetical protein